MRKLSSIPTSKRDATHSSSSSALVKRGRWRHVPNAMESTVRLRDQPLENKTVTLLVYRWESVQPGPIAWTFSDLDAAIKAVRAMKNALGWAVLQGTEVPSDIERERSLGRILLESVLPSDA